MMPLIYAEIGEPQIIKKTGGSPEIKKHLEDLGFCVGSQVSVVSSCSSCRVGNTLPFVTESDPNQVSR